jgi:predicted aspartyl protease
MRFRFDLEHELVVIPAEVFGPKGSTVANMALDTGATASLMNLDILLTVGYDLRQVKTYVLVTTGSGIERAPRLMVKNLVAWGVQKKNFPVIAHTLPPTATVDGLLGFDFMKKRRLILDFRKGLASLK